ncbi:glycosyltransferase family 25 protein [Mesorhizobium sp. M00.F.Ca.ET.186.01.1.1]|nr:glycosyltransferase family 25 protein [bacterium M00.F.Ca.ET.205.01.1.1]TGU49316.1 glycosyltransferase family 25 protein [bacterium M00.F.Ca.ET.152.01.1.1]TGV33054.1 glycosyltransferase family 25 protein [Mesorhizobium sp. M00.F.Ca.ET.186.01.1.1]TGZ40295.1 glycosyltransferase family 25 protein [bacterium M00.F.Ca.ET.162.01.1.1]TIW61189.1 MAG: glycosyltransferase family 25 protein [Mesorhizobium sp.]
MKHLVINLDRSPDRLAHMTAEFARMGIAFERVAAIDARERPDLVLQPQHALYAVRRLSGSEVACLHSHRACWTIIAQDDAPYGAVFEDDIVFSAKAGALLADTDWVPADADIVKLETFFQRTVIQRGGISVGPGFSVSRLRKNHIGSGGYLLSRQAARDLLQASAEVNVAIDSLIFDPAFATSTGKTIYQLVPALCAQDQFMGNSLPSLIHQGRQDEWVASGLAGQSRKPVIERIRREAWRIARWIADFCRFRRQIIVPLDPIKAKD